MVRGGSRLTRDALREVRFTFTRFLSITVLAALAVAFLAGLRTTAPDMQYTADNYYDRFNMMDGYVMSTLGLVEEDLTALAAADGIEAVEGGWALDAIAVDMIVTVRSMPERINLLSVKEGRLPQGADECVTEAYLMEALGLSVGDTLTLTMDEDHEGDLSRTAYRVVGVVESTLYVGPDRGASSLGNGSVDAYLFVPGENFTYDYYTVAYFTGSGLRELNSYGDAYEDGLDALVNSLEPLADQRAQNRYDTLVGDAQTEIDDAWAELNDAKAEAEAELADGAEELADARVELDDGWAEYYDGRRTFDREIADAEKKLADALADLEQGEADYTEGMADYEQGLVDYEEGLADYREGLAEFEKGEAEYLEGLAEYEEGLKAYEDGLAGLGASQAQVSAGYKQYNELLKAYEGTDQYEMMVAALAAQKAQLDAAQAQISASGSVLAQAKMTLDEARAELDEAAAEVEEGRQELADAERELADAERELAEARQELADARTELDDGWAEYYDGLETLEEERRDGRRELADALVELTDGEAEYADGLREYEEGKAEAETEIADAERKLADAQAELDDIDQCEWYVLGRDTNYGFASYAQDSDRISNLSTVFPIIFFLVAALACLTTMTRMVEEQRTQIGALKAMGFSRLAISRKYIGYAFFASLIGGALGLLLGCTLIPMVIANAFNIMYRIPTMEILLQPSVYLLSVGAAVAATTGAALWACLSTLVDTPANLMRPKAPKAGKRVALEYITPLWKRLGFTWKVTMRNLFRYQRRFWMTVIGIGGCTALIVTGFGLHDSIYAILDKQFDEISLYDATVGLDEELTAEQWEGIRVHLDNSDTVSRWMAGYSHPAEFSTTGLARGGSIFLVEDQAEFTRFIDLRHRLDDQPVRITDEGVLITEKLSELLEVSVGDAITIEEDDVRVRATVSDIVENYTSHYVYMTEKYYEELFGHLPADSIVLIDYAPGTDEGASDILSREMMATDGVVSYSFIATMRESFTDSMNSVNYAVVIIILAAAALAFVVLYNLTNINITERRRELATLKVLGFYDREITAYVYRENIFLTLFGIALGMGMGKLLHSFLVLTVEVEQVMFGRTAPPYAYILAAALTVVFSVMVNVAAHFRLKKVDMVESLKTVE